ncbi:MAG TPA: phage holin family protein [Jatrophihabitans sp.]|nr:phage holin family protein [Jatrophihabitans sp.]
MTASSSPAPEPTRGPSHASDAAPTAFDKPDTTQDKPAKHAAEPSIGQLVSDASTHLSNLMHSEIELAKLELRSTVKNAGTGFGFFGAAAVILVFSLTFGFLTLAEGINAAGLSRWLSFLIVFAVQLVVVAICAFLGIKKVKRIRAPEQTIKTTKETVNYLKKTRG